MEVDWILTIVVSLPLQSKLKPCLMVTCFHFSPSKLGLSVWFLLTASWITVVTCAFLRPCSRSAKWQTCMKTSEMDITWSRCWRSSLGKHWWVLPLTSAWSNKCLSCASFTLSILKTEPWSRLIAWVVFILSQPAISAFRQQIVSNRSQDVSQRLNLNWTSINRDPVTDFGSSGVYPNYLTGHLFLFFLFSLILFQFTSQSFCVFN